MVVEPYNKRYFVLICNIFYVGIRSNVYGGCRRWDMVVITITIFKKIIYVICYRIIMDQ